MEISASELRRYELLEELVSENLFLPLDQIILFKEKADKLLTKQDPCDKQKN